MHGTLASIQDSRPYIRQSRQYAGQYTIHSRQYVVRDRLDTGQETVFQDNVGTIFFSLSGLGRGGCVVIMFYFEFIVPCAVQIFTVIK